MGAHGCWPATITTGPTGTALADVKLPRNRICDQRCWHCWHAPGVDNNPIFFFLRRFEPLGECHLADVGGLSFPSRRTRASSKLSTHLPTPP